MYFNVLQTVRGQNYSFNAASDLHLLSNSMKEKKSTSKGNIALALVSLDISYQILVVSTS